MNVVLRNGYLVLIDAFFIAVSVCIALVIRFETLAIQPYLELIWFAVPLLIAVRLPLFYFFGLYRRVWRYASVNELLSVVMAVFLSSVVVIFVIFGVAFPLGIVKWFPRSLIAIDFLLSILLSGGFRFGLRVLSVRKIGGRAGELKRPSETTARVLIAGAGDAGAIIAREVRENPGLGILPVGFIDDDERKLGMRIHGVRVLGTREDIPHLMTEEWIDEVIIAIPTAPGKEIREITRICEQSGVPARTVPGLYELIGGRLSVSQIREVQLEDLLRREPVTIDMEEISKHLSDRVVLVTGAGGSIGSELCRQIAAYAPLQLLLVGKGEHSIFAMQWQLSDSFPELDTVPVIADVRDRSKMGKIMALYKPSIVFHAAAHKHVNLMEQNPDEAVTNNILGTQSVAEAAALHGVERFVLISTDKAVRPTSVMGACKRVAEMLMQDMAIRNSTSFITVRFGNVLGSRGSAISIFRRQIAAGGPVTVTHPDAERYFMTVPEATQLVVQAAIMGERGSILVLDMGDPLRIVDLAKDLVELSGLKVGEDIDLMFIGLRPGEKLCEELFSPEEKVSRTRHASILRVRPRPIDHNRLYAGIEDLEMLAQQADAVGIRRKLQEIVPEYQPTD
jgi:FlaA1/EpsC-like NDP-sugar epimerase